MVSRKPEIGPSRSTLPTERELPVRHIRLGRLPARRQPSHHCRGSDVVTGTQVTAFDRSNTIYCLDMSRVELSSTLLQRSIPDIPLRLVKEVMAPSCMITESIVKHRDAWYGIKRIPLEETKLRVNNLREREMFILQ